MARSGHRRGQRGRVGVDVVLRALLGYRDQQAVLVSAVERLERDARQDLLFRQALDDALRGLRQLERELLEERRAVAQPNARNAGERLRRVMRLGHRELADLPEPAL